jgi:hypothetical protein
MGKIEDKAATYPTLFILMLYNLKSGGENIPPL